MPCPRRRHSRQRQAKRRTHERLYAKSVAKCDNCGAPKLSHQVCPACGQYRGRSYKTIVNS
jgi:large subunit ribosomal protein L32